MLKKETLSVKGLDVHLEYRVEKSGPEVKSGVSGTKMIIKSKSSSERGEKDQRPRVATLHSGKI